MTKGTRTEQFLEQVVPVLAMFVIVVVVVCGMAAVYDSRLDEIEQEQTSDYDRVYSAEGEMPHR